MEMHCVYHDAESGRFESFSCAREFLMRSSAQEPQFMDGKIKRVAPLPSLRS